MNVVFYHENEDSLFEYWKVGLETCGATNVVPIIKSLIPTEPLYTKIISSADLMILENPSEFELDVINKIQAKKKICIIDDNYKEFYKNYPSIDLWVEPCFYDKATENSFKKDNLPFHYCPRASQDCFIPFYTELDRKFDVSEYFHSFNDNFNTTIVSIKNPEITYGNTKINYNPITLKDNYVYLNQQAFDIPMSGNFELCNVPEVINIFEGKVGYTNFTDFNDKVQYYIDHEEERTRMAIKGYEVCIAKHTYTYRMRDLLKKLKML